MSSKKEELNKDDVETNESVFQEKIHTQPQKEVSMLIKISVLICTVFFAAGSHYGDSAVSTIKTEIKHTIHATNSQYGAIQAAIYLINTIFPFFGGLMIDKIGAGGGSLASASSVLIGEILISLGVQFKNYPSLLIGRIIHGFGIGIISVAQESLLSKWFSGSGLGLVLGIQIASSRLFGWLGQSTTIPINQATGTVTACLWLGVGLSVLGVLSTICYIFIVKSVGGEPRDPHATPEHRRSFSPRVILYLPTGFWLIPLNYFILGSVWEPFMGNVKPFVQEKWNYSSEVAGYISSITRGIPVVLTPLTGFFLDRIGFRGPLLIFCNIILTISFILFGYTNLSPYASLTLFSINKSIGVVTLISSIPLIVPPHLVATGLSLYRIATSAGEGIFNIAWGIIQDGDHNEYSQVIGMMLGLSVIATVASIIYFIFDIFYSHYLLNASNTKRAIIKEKYAGDMPADRIPPMSQNPTIFSIFATATLASSVAVCWGLFIYVLAVGKEAG